MSDTPPPAHDNVLRARFERAVDRSGKHHLWLGAKNPRRGTGRIKVSGKQATAHRIAWELHHGILPESTRVSTCPDEPSCVRIEHLSALAEPSATSKRPRSLRGTGSKREIRPGVWKLEVTAGVHNDGSPRREYKTIDAANSSEAAIELSLFVVEVRDAPIAPARDLKQMKIDEAIKLFLDNYLASEKGREDVTVKGYRQLHALWFSPHIGNKLVRHVEPSMIDNVFGRMRRSGLSRSRMNQAKSLYSQFFRWARSRRMTSTNPMLEFQLPTSKQVSQERTPPEAEELSVLLNEALNVVPEVAPMLVLGAVTGMRRGEIAGLRRDRIVWDELRLTVDTSISETRNVKGTKTRKERSFYIDAESLEMLRRHCEQMNERAALFGTTISPNGFVFSLEPDCSVAMSPDFFTKRVGELKDHLGIAENSPEVIELQDKALALRRQPVGPRPAGKTGPMPTGGLSYVEIGKRLNRSERWAALAVKSAERREAAVLRKDNFDFDGSIIALRKFTSSELLDAGFNVSLVAQRQGHGPQVLIKHYAKSRKSADRKAAEHLGRVVHTSAES